MSDRCLQVPALQGHHVRLEPLAQAHAEGLRLAVADGELHRLWYTSAPAPDAVEAYLQAALHATSDGQAQAFAVRSMASGAIVGTTRYCHADAVNRRLEIGYTWYAASAQRTGVNTESKYLLLRHAFEQLDCIAVEFRTHWLNQRSRAAIARLGARQDGILRNHSRLPDGSLRDTVVFSIIASEWPAVKQHLQFIQEQR
ncbi:GNAT family N-acetyltransferase [Frateuria aurantia]|uniref:Acetyltransferase, ribosomal protein N-acetylase n=1 Tax=Frateuria aurantia (strain ATCC 33424 / DSM 6220 / KCTC 2777 / LMG 1558 / NBRC 3245 / NCIMB 13370) TaxID=767434 RepID=H8L3H0_FRAAD|nr:GNAT family protein [Frateuria aurantia]AFC86492.1 acetyltransferase, ribosomal protein N-acetylase [Frateuria aurantia DSM 6220]